MKYPRTPHLPTSPGMTDDDKVCPDLSALYATEVVVTEKMDGENTTMTPDRCHARSLDSDGSHPSRHRVMSLWGEIRHEIPEGWRVCGENVYARHSIAYVDLPSPFLMFNVWDGPTALSWADTEAVAGMLGLHAVPVLYRGPFDLKAVTLLGESVRDRGGEGVVVRVAESFHADDFHFKVAKWVRAGHVQTDQHWMRSSIVPNGFR